MTLLFSCTAHKKLSTINYAVLYNRPFCNPQFKVFHWSSDSSLFYFSFTNDDLLFKRNESGNMEAGLGIGYSLYNSYHKTEILDSASIIELVKYDSLGSGYTGSIKFRALSGSDYILKILFNDLNRNFVYIYSINVKKTGRQSAQFFDLHYSDDQPYMQSIVQPGVKLKLAAPNLSYDSIAVRCYFRHFPLAPPPFSDVPSARFEYSADSIYYLKTSSLAEVHFSKTGFYHLQFDTISKDGVTIYVFDNDFPSFTRPEQLIESLRYLCTRAEYNDLLGKKDKKKAIDDYWLAKAGNNERGRKLIRVYYNRSFIANKLFTSYMEGWKTDRGMIYLIFGPPQTVYRDKMYETWRYAVSEGIPDIQFIFTKVNNPFSDNDYELERKQDYQGIWYQAVDTWRTGRIVGEN